MFSNQFCKNIFIREIHKINKGFISNIRTKKCKESNSLEKYTNVIYIPVHMLY